MSISNAPIAGIQWISYSDGGRAYLPAGSSYSAVARFSHQGAKWNQNAWSVVIQFIDQPDGQLWQRAEVRFVVDWAPTNWLYVGIKFELMEGEKVVAIATVLSM